MGLSKQNVVVNVAKTEGGYSASCDLLDGWVVAVTGDWSDLEREVRDSIDFYIDCAKEDGDSYPEIFDRDYRIEYRFDVQVYFVFIRIFFLFRPCSILPESIKSSWAIMLPAGPSRERSKPRKS